MLPLQENFVKQGLKTQNLEYFRGLNIQFNTMCL